MKKNTLFLTLTNFLSLLSFTKKNKKQTMKKQKLFKILNVIVIGLILSTFTSCAQPT